MDNKTETYSVIYLTYDGLTDPLGQSQVLPYIIGLSEQGHRFTVVSFEKLNRMNILREQVSELCNSHGIKWIPLRYHKKPPVLSTIFDLFNLWFALKREFNQRTYDIVHCRSYITSIVGVKAKRKWAVKFLFDMRGFWADERVEGGLWNLSSPLYRKVYGFFKNQESTFLKQADHIISLTHSARNELLSWKIARAPITVIPTCVDVQLFNPAKIQAGRLESLRAELDINANQFVMLYLGSLGTWYLTEELLRFFSACKMAKSGSKLLIVSTDAFEITDPSLREDIVVVSANREEVPYYISLANVGVCFIKPSFSKKASSATKMAEIVAMNVPIVVNRGWGDVDRWKSEPGIVTVDLDATGSFAATINQIGTAGRVRTEFLNEFSLQEGLLRYAAAYKQSMSSLHKRNNS